jgi:serine/threonine protein kinase/Tfp pilus assembly protein PilF
MIGQTISHYNILEKLGEGGMGVVYKAEDLKLKRNVALKFLPSRFSRSEQDRARFMQEAQAASALNHPNILTIYEFDQSDGQYFIAMEFVEGESLKARLDEVRSKGTLLPIDQVLDFATQIAEGLAHAHEKGIIHRDIKSDNLMITAMEGRVKIMDFGLAKLRGNAELTRAGTTLGTIVYMAPEQIAAGEVDHRADLWAFGVVLYEMLSGERPFGGEHVAAIMYEILNVDPKAVQSFRADIPEAIQTLVSQLLQKEAARRTSSAIEILTVLKKRAAQAPDASQQNSIAVLYFENMSPDKESDYFCAGMTEDLITDLSKIKDLKVVPRADVIPLRNKEVNTRQVGELLRVNYVLEGSVRKAGNKMRITGQLIDVRTGFHLWADRFDRLIEDIFDLQTEVSQKIADALKVSLTDSEKQSLAHKPTHDLRAYDLYLRGRELLYRRGKKNNEAAIQMFENALSLDPNFVSAYGALAEAFSYMFSWYDGDQKWLGKTIEASQRALALDPDSIDAQFGTGTVYFHQKRLNEAKRTWEKVIQHDPEFYDAYRWLGIASDVTGDYDAALRYYEQCARLKPFSEEPWMHIEMTYRRMGNAEASEQSMRKLIEVGSRKLEVNPDDAVALSRITTPIARLGDPAKAHAALKRVLEIDPADGLLQYNCACSYAMLGDKQEALACLKNAIHSGYKNVNEWVQNDPDLISLHQDPEYVVLLNEMV